MTHHTLNASVPQHLYGMVQTDILQGMDDSQGFEPCVIIGVTSIPSRCLHFSILCESGAQWARIPIHMLRWNEPEIAPHPITDLQCWDCHGWDFSTVQYEYLREMGCEYRKPDGTLVPASQEGATRRTQQLQGNADGMGRQQSRRKADGTGRWNA